MLKGILWRKILFEYGILFFCICIVHVLLDRDIKVIDLFMHSFVTICVILCMECIDYKVNNWNPRWIKQTEEKQERK
jgi:hypothetical protein